MIIRVHVKPNAKTDSVIVAEDNELHIRIREVPADGKANKYLVGYLSQIFNVPKSSVTISKGLHTPHKAILINADDEYIKSVLNTLPHA
jgi:uncharacterized protein (TIGR00251 family)